MLEDPEFAQKPDGFENHESWFFLKKINLKVKPLGITYTFLPLVGNQDSSSRHSFRQHAASLPASRKISKGRYQSRAAQQPGI